MNSRLDNSEPPLVAGGQGRSADSILDAAAMLAAVAVITATIAAVAWGFSWLL